MLSIASEDETTTPFSSSSVHEVSTQSVTAVGYFMWYSPDAKKNNFRRSIAYKKSRKASYQFKIGTKINDAYEVLFY
jgi:hypothetical protein